MNRRLALAAVVTAAAVAATCAPARANGASELLPRLAAGAPISWWSGGDSYGSGEGIARTPGILNACAQSPFAYGPRSARLVKTKVKASVTPVAFTACTGSVISQIFQDKNHSHPNQFDWAMESRPPRGKFDVITMSIGGNDLGFPDVMKSCIDPVWIKSAWDELVGSGGHHCNAGGKALSSAELRSRVDALVHPTDKGTASISALYQRLATHLRPGGVLVIAGYPRLFAPSEQWAKWRLNRCETVGGADADMLGEATTYLNEALSGAVDEASKKVAGVRIVYESRYDLFHADGISHELCSDDSAWINGITAGTSTGTIRVAQSFHPNAAGHEATARETADLVVANLGVDSRPTRTSTPIPKPTASLPTATPIGSSWTVGGEVSTRCSVAWPTAPVRTSTSIQLRMTCAGQPRAYLFVDVEYDDPSFPITPSTGPVLVTGTVVDVATSGYGFKTVLVHARRMTIP